MRGREGGEEKRERGEPERGESGKGGERREGERRYIYIKFAEKMCSNILLIVMLYLQEGIGHLLTRPLMLLNLIPEYCR